MRTYQLISGDAHLETPPYAWTRRVPARFQEFAPKVVKAPEGGDLIVLKGMPNPMTVGLNFGKQGGGPENIRVRGVSYDERPPGSGDAAQRCRELDRDGLDAEVLFAAIAGPTVLSQIPDREGQIANIRAYNDWLSEEFCSYAPERLLGMAILPETGVEDAVSELERVAKMPNIRGVILHRWPNGSPAPVPEDDKFWALAEEMDYPLSAHVSFGSGGVEELNKTLGGNFAPLSQLLGNGCPAPGGTVVQLITHGVVERFPRLRIFFAETGIGWLPYYMEQMDDRYTRHHVWAGVHFKEMPSNYVRRHFWWSFQVDRIGLQLRHEIGLDRIIWATDFPHGTSDWPNSRRLIDDQFADLPPEEKQMIVCDNILNYLGIKAG
jgi:predicted TIM-barrel fold metal-dependent hydrolase